jgi:hypothetical protein
MMTLTGENVVPTTEPKSQLSVFVPADLHRRAKVRAAEDDRKLHEIVTEGLRLLLDGHPSEPADRATA